MAKAKSSIKEGSVMEGLFAMHCAAILIDPNDGKNTANVNTFIKSLAISTKLKDLLTKETKGPNKGKFKQAVSYKNTFPINSSAPKTSIFGVKVVKGSDAKTTANNPKLRVAPDLDYFETIAKEGYPDFSRVELKVVLKEKEVGEQYGKKLQALIDSQPELKGTKQKESFESIQRRVDAMINAKGSTFFRKIQSVKRKYLNNNRIDVMQWQIDADGIGGEGSGGKLKQDITIRIWANGKRIFDDTINFSLKASSATIHSGGLEKGLDLLINTFGYGLPKNKYEDIQRIWANIKNGTEKSTGLNGYVDTTFRTILSETSNITITESNSNMWWNLLTARLFGEQNAYKGYMQVVELNHDSIKKVKLPKIKGKKQEYTSQHVSGVKEITPDWIQELRNNGMKLYAKMVYKNIEQEGSPGGIYIMPIYKNGVKEDTDGRMLYKIRINYLRAKDESGSRTGSKEPFKFMTDIGGEGKSIIWEHNKNDSYFVGKL